jgi:FkbM family methyltransferase
MLKEKIKKAMKGKPLYYPMRNAFRFFFDRESWRHRKEMLSFYSQFVSPGDLVLDVGANVGMYSEVFLHLGARVAAVEPNPDCAAQLKDLRPRERLTVECVALGSTNSEATLYMTDADTLSTLSPEWIAAHAPKLVHKEFNRTIRVPVVTLDELIAKHGTPKFIKIDVEGFEKEVLDGLTRAPRFLSFEFSTYFLDAAFACIRNKCFRADAQFNLTIRQSVRLSLEQWVSATQIIEHLKAEKAKHPGTYGEVFVRTPSERKARTEAV